MHGIDPAALGASLLTLLQEIAAPAARAAEEAASRPGTAERSLRFLAGAYIVVWGVLGAYMLILSVRLRALSRQVRRLKERLEG